MLLGGSAALMLLFFGGSHPAFWAPVCGVFLVAAAGFTLAGKITFRLPNRRWAALLVGLPCIPLLQSIPLPEGLLQGVSPTRAAWLFQAEKTAGIGQAPAALSYLSWDTVFIGGLWFFFAGYALLLARTLDRSREERARIIRFFFVLAVFQAAYGIIQVLIPSVGVLWDTDRSYRGFARGTFINRNNYAAFLGLLWPVLLAYTLKLPGGRRGNRRQIQDERRQQRLFFGFLTGLVLLALVFSASRAGILSTLIASTLFLGLAGTRRKEPLVAVVGCWVVLLAYGAVIGFDGILTRFDRLECDTPGRFRIWRDTWTLIQDHPWTGIGLGSFQEVFRVYQTHLPEFSFARHAHNDYLQWIAELGWPLGLAGIALLWGFWLRNARRILALRRNPGRADPTVAAGCLAGMAAFLLHAWVDFPFQMAANVLTLIAVMTLLRAEVRHQTIDFKR